MSKRIQELAEQAEEQARVITKSDMGFMGFEIDEDEFRRVFAELVRADEREACAIAAWSTGMDLHMKKHDAREIGSACAAAIRARSQQ